MLNKCKLSEQVKNQQIFTAHLLKAQVQQKHVRFGLGI